MAERKSSRLTTATRVYVIIVLFVTLILGMVLLFQFQMDASVAMRAFAGGEGLWAKAQKDAVISLEHYIVSHDEADYQNFRRWIQVPLGDQKARMELQQEHPDLDAVRSGLLQGRNHPVDIEYFIPFFRRFQHTAHVERVLEHWMRSDHLIAELGKVAETLHGEITSARASPQAIRAIHARLKDINQEMTYEEDQFSFALAEASRWANGISRRLIYAIAFLFAVLGIILPWPIFTRIRATESELSDSEQKFRSITTSALDAIAMIDEEGKTVFFNEAAEKMFGYAAEEVLGKEMHPLLAQPRYLDDYRRAYVNFTQSGEGAAIGKVLELGALRKDGSEFPIELSVSAIRINGRWNAVGIIRDITGRKQAEAEISKLNVELETKVQERTEQLLKAQEELVRNEKLAVLGKVAGSVGHELRNPLGVISNAVFFLQSVLPNTDPVTREYLNIIKNEISGSERIVSDLLDAVRTRPPNPLSVGVAGLVDHALRDYGVPPSVSIKLDIPAEISPLRVDPQQIHMVLNKLISNSLDAMPDGGILEITAREDTKAGRITVSVKDSGVGIAPEDLPNIFQPLFTTKARGIGLGLVVVKNLIEVNGGIVEVQSEVGKGARFTVTLPSADTAIEPA